MRDFRSFFSLDQLQTYQAGTLKFSYKGVPCLKSPIDVALYLNLLGTARPATLFEIGSKAGGSALLFRDFARLHGLGAQIVSIDINPPDTGPGWDGIRFVKGDVNDLRQTFSLHSLGSLPRPWLVVEDSAHTYFGCLATLDFFSDALLAGEYLVMEDGILDELGLSERYDGGPNRAIADHFLKHPDIWEIDTDYCDMFGRNATYNPNGYLRRKEAKWSIRSK